MAPTLSELRAMSDEELVRLYDHEAKSVNVHLNFLSGELARREQARQTRAMLRYTRWITAMTVVVTVATLVNLGVALGWIG